MRQQTFPNVARSYMRSILYLIGARGRLTAGSISMRVRVLFFGVLKDLAGKSSDLLDLPDGALVRDVLAHYGSRFRV